MRSSLAAISSLFLFAGLGAAARHNAKVRSGGLSLDSREAFLKGGNSGMGAGEAVRKAVRGEQPFPRMPFGGALSADEIQIVEHWTAAGSQLPEAPAASDGDKASSGGLWSLHPIRMHAVPEVRDKLLGADGYRPLRAGVSAALPK
jgi:hypothetical protein